MSRKLSNDEVVGVDLFAGCGGFTEAATRAGVKVQWAANHWELAVRVHAANHPTVMHAQQDLRQADFSLLDPFDFLFASPSCQGHSSAGRPGRAASSKVAKTHDNLRSTAWAVTDCLEVCRPKFALIENVPEFMRWVLIPQWLSCMRALGYAVTRQVLTASKWGTPQRRRRVFFIAHHEGPPIELSDPDVAEPGAREVYDEDAPGWKPIDRVSHRPSKKGHKTAREKVEIANARLGGELGWGQHVNSQSVWGVSPRVPVNTVTTQAGQLWWVRDGEYRLWTRGEVCKAMGFPADYDFLDVSKTDSYKMLGNAVPPSMGEGIIRAVRERAGL